MKHIPLLLLPLLAAGCVAPGTKFPPVGIADRCGATQFASLAGQPRSALDGIVLPEGARVILVGEPVTLDYREDRLNFEIDGNAAISRVFCG